MAATLTSFFLSTPLSPSPKTLTLTRPLLPSLPPIVLSTSTVPTSDRVFSTLTYTLPVLTFLSHSPFHLSSFPTLASNLSTFHASLPLTSTLSFLVHFAVTFLLIPNPRFSPFVRFHASDALFLSLFLCVPPGGFPGFQFTAIRVWYRVGMISTLVEFVVRVVSAVLGRAPPLLAFLERFFP